MSGFTAYDICIWARRQKTGSSARKAVLMALAEHADRTHWECRPSIELMADELELHADTVGRNLKRLEKDGFIERRRIRRADGSYAGWVFRLNPAGVQVVTPPTPASEHYRDIGCLPSGSPETDHPTQSRVDDQDVVDGAAGDHNSSHPTLDPDGRKPNLAVDPPPTAPESGPIEEQFVLTDPPYPPGGEGSPEGGKEKDPAAAFLAALERRIGEQAVAAWFAGIAVEPVDEGGLMLRTASLTRAERIAQRYRRDCEAAWREFSGAGGPVRIVHDPAVAAGEKAAQAATLARFAPAEPAAAGRRRKRAAAPPADAPAPGGMKVPAASDGQWLFRIAFRWACLGQWESGWGAAPDDPACAAVPQAISRAAATFDAAFREDPVDERRRGGVAFEKIAAHWRSLDAGGRAMIRKRRETLIQPSTEERTAA